MLQSESVTHPFQPGAQQGLRSSWATLQRDALWKAGKEREGMEENKDKPEVEQMYGVRKEKEEAGD